MGMSKRHGISAAAALALATIGPAGAVSAEASRSFAFTWSGDQGQLLAGQSRGGYLHIAGEPDPGEALPLVVFLHGLNFGTQLHVWMGGGQADLRASADRVAENAGAFILAAPSQTANAAAARTLWASFDLDAFVDEVSRAARESGVRVDRDRVLLVGHSGAGCGEGVGLYAPRTAEETVPAAILAIDPCLDEDLGRSAARVGRPIVVAWQDSEWPRDPDGMERGFADEVSREEADRLTMEPLTVPGNDAHNGVVPVAFERFVPELLASSSLTP